MDSRLLVGVQVVYDLMSKEEVFVLSVISSVLWGLLGCGWWYESTCGTGS